MKQLPFLKMVLTNDQLNLALRIAAEEGVITYNQINHFNSCNYSKTISLQNILQFCYNSNDDINEKKVDDLIVIYFYIFSSEVNFLYYRILCLNSKNSLRHMIGKWNPPTKTQMRISEVIDEIYQNVIEQNTGEYVFYNGRFSKTFDKGKEYHLIIDNNICLFFNYYRETVFRIVFENKCF